MKTKHLLFAAALPLAFAACQNEEFESAGSAELSKDQRPLVEVKLNFQKEGADTRVSYNGTKNEYGWQSTDKIGAFLMDEVVSSNRPFGATADEWAKESWLEHYKLVNYIHTDYPFSWNATTKEWTAPSKLQEGNYFFACPYETYEGQRQLIHYLDGQTQTGGTEANMNAAIAKNQYFIGYGQVKAGTGNKEALKEVVMTPVLAPVKVTLRNIGTVAKNVEKVVIRGAQVSTALTVDPTDAAYYGTEADGSLKGENDGKTYSLVGSNLPQAWSVKGDTYFNYANLLGEKEDLYQNKGTNFVYNIASGATDYNQGDALRQTVHESYTDNDNIPAIEQQAVLSFTKPVTVAANNGEIHFAVMVNTVPEVKKYNEDNSTTTGLFMDIIMTEGRITSIDLTNILERENGLGGGLKENTVITNNAIKSLKPGVKNELIIQFDNNSVVKAQEIEVQDEATLLAFIKWNQENQRINTATLIKDVTLTKEMYTILTSAANKGTLKVTGSGKLLVADNVPVNVLNVLEKETNTTVVLNGTRTLTKAVADKLVGAEMTIENQGTLNVTEAEVVANAAELVNYGTIKVAKNASLKGTTSNKITNYGMIENLGGIYNVKNSVEGEAKGWIKTSAGDNHIADNEAGATIQLTSIKDTYTVVNEKYKGAIYYETAAGVKASELNDQKVTKLNVTGGTITLDDKDAETVTDLTIKGGTVVVKGVNDKNESAYHKFTNVAEASIDGSVTFDYAGIAKGDVVAEEGAKLTFSGKNATLNLPNVTFIKGATVNVTTGTTVEAANLVWNGNSVTNLGTFQYTGTSDNTPVVKAGNEIKKKTETSPATPVDVTIGRDKYESLAALALAVNNGDVTVGSITISENLEVTVTKEGEEELDKNDYTYLKSLAEGKEVKLGADLSGLKKSMGISFGKLTLTAPATISGDENQPLLSILTVNDIDISKGKLTITNGRVKLNEEGKQGAASEHVYGATKNLEGTITDSTESFYYENKWKAF